MEKLPGPLFGASITGAEGGANNTDSTSISLIKMDPKKDAYSLSQVDENGAVVIAGGLPVMVLLQNLGAGGIEVAKGSRNGDILKSGDETKVKIGPHELDIVATRKQALTLNGEKAEEMTEDLKEIMYPGMTKEA